jgi:hypothetical protein
VEPGSNLGHDLHPTCDPRVWQYLRTDADHRGKDRTAPGSNRASAEVAKTLGQYPKLTRRSRSRGFSQIFGNSDCVGE